MLLLVNGKIYTLIVSCGIYLNWRILWDFRKKKRLACSVSSLYTQLGPIRFAKDTRFQTPLVLVRAYSRGWSETVSSYTELTVNRFMIIIRRKIYKARRNAARRLQNFSNQEKCSHRSTFMCSLPHDFYKTKWEHFQRVVFSIESTRKNNKIGVNNKVTIGNNVFIDSIIIKSNCRIMQFLHQMCPHYMYCWTTHS